MTLEWGTDENCRILEQPSYSRGDWRVSFTGDIQQNGFRLHCTEPHKSCLATIPAKRLPLFQ